MKCPLCIDATLDVTHHGGIEVDICPRCRGVWLDRGELDRLLGDAEPRRDDAPRDDVRRDERTDTTPASRPDKARRKRRFADRLSDVFEDVLDL